MSLKSTKLVPSPLPPWPLPCGWPWPPTAAASRPEIWDRSPSDLQLDQTLTFIWSSWSYSFFEVTYLSYFIWLINCFTKDFIEMWWTWHIVIHCPHFNLRTFLVETWTIKKAEFRGRVQRCKALRGQTSPPHRQLQIGLGIAWTFPWFETYGKYGKIPLTFNNLKQ